MSGTIRSTGAQPTQAVLVILGDLLNGKTHDRRTIATRVGVKPAAADRIIAAVKSVPRVECNRVHRRQVLRLADIVPGDLSLPMPLLVAACIGGTLAPLFTGTRYESGIREVVARLLRNGKSGGNFEDIDRKFYFVHRGGEVSLPAKAGELDEIADALLRSEPIVLKYQHFDGSVAHPHVQPLSLVIYNHQIYLFARYAQGDVRALRLSRMSNIRRIERPFEYPPRTEYDPEQICRDGFGIFIEGGPPEDVEVRLDGRWAVHARTHRWHPSQHIECHGKSVTVKLRVRVCPELEAWILSFGAEAEVLAPASLRTTIAARLREALEKYPGQPL